MPDLDQNKEAADYGLGIPVKNTPFFLKGLHHLDWGMQDRLARIFQPRSGRTVMLAFDHGYIMGPTSGLERMDLAIPPLIPHADCLMCTRGALRTIVPPDSGKPVALRFSAGTTVLTELNEECILDIEDALRLNASALAVMAAIGSRFEAVTIANLVRTADLGQKYGIPTLGVTAVGKELTRDWRYLSLACRVCAENGATFVKTYYCEPHFERVTASCPVPIIIAGGKKVPEAQALEFAARALEQGAAGVDMGRNVFQAEAPVAMLQALRAVVHDRLPPKDAFELYQSLKSKPAA